MEAKIYEIYPNDPAKRASYLYTAKAINDEWNAYFTNKNITFEEILPYFIKIMLGTDLIDENDPNPKITYKAFKSLIKNTKTFLFAECCRSIKRKPSLVSI